ncbi:MAG: family 78 glycoside hydrolase catalytic domain [Planctomycetota bacterium]
MTQTSDPYIPVSVPSPTAQAAETHGSTAGPASTTQDALSPALSNTPGWVGPSQNLKSSPLPAMGAWIAPADRPMDHAADHAGSADPPARLETVFALNEGYPRCFGMVWVAAQPGCSIWLNGQALDLARELSPGRVDQVQIPWDKLQRGRNTLAVHGDHSALAQGVAVLARVHQARGETLDVQSGPHWSWASATGHGIAKPVLGTTPAPQPLDNGPRRSVEMRRRFELASKPQTATVRVTGLGVYELCVNGKRVGDALLEPGWTDYDRAVHLSTHDVTDHLVEGVNTVSAVLGNGWWGSGMGWEGLGKTLKPDHPLRLWLDLAIEEPGGRAVRIASDERWDWRPSAILCDSIYHGQTEDLTNAWQEPWQAVSILQEASWPERKPAPAEPIRVTETLRAHTVRRLDQERVLFDFGQNHAGRPRLRLDRPEGRTVCITYCEVVDDQGRPYFDNYRTASATDRVRTGSAPIDWAPAFTYRGYRYAVVTGLPDGDIDLKQALLSEVIHNDVATASRFESDNPLFNQIDRIVRWGVRSNLHSVPTDCPQRDERLGWTGDVALFAPASCWQFDLQGFYRKFLDDLIGAQFEDGRVPHIAPFVPTVPEDSSPAWADVITMLPTVLHRFYGGPDTLRYAYPSMKKWVDWFAGQTKQGVADIHGFGDWLGLQETPAEFCSAAYLPYSGQLVADAASRLGLDEDERHYAGVARRARQAFNERYYDATTHRYAPNTQTGQVMPLAFGITPAEHTQSVADELAKMVHSAEDKPTTGFIGTAFLLPMLSRYGHHELASRVLNTRDFPSLGYMIDQGATTVWERWDSDRQGPDMNSRNHFCLGSMAQWLYEDLAGVKPDPAHPGFRHVRLEPRPTAAARRCALDYQSPQGPLRFAWEHTGDGLRVELDLPAPTRATLRLPSGERCPELAVMPGARERLSADDAAEYELDPGVYRFAAPLFHASTDSM